MGAWLTQVNYAIRITAFPFSFTLPQPNRRTISLWKASINEHFRGYLCGIPLNMAQYRGFLKKCAGIQKKSAGPAILAPARIVTPRRRRNVGKRACLPRYREEPPDPKTGLFCYPLLQPVK